MQQRRGTRGGARTSAPRYPTFNGSSAPLGVDGTTSATMSGQESSLARMFSAVWMKSCVPRPIYLHRPRTG